MKEPDKNKLSPSKLLWHLKNATDFFKGFEDPNVVKNHIIPMVFFKRISDVFEEEYQTILDREGKRMASLKDYYEAYIPENCRWVDILNDEDNLFGSLKNALGQIEQANPHLEGIFSSMRWHYSDEYGYSRILRRLMEHISKYNLSNSNISALDLSLVIIELDKRTSLQTEHIRYDNMLLSLLSP